jgi:hypothetical protein
MSGCLIPDRVPDSVALMTVRHGKDNNGRDDHDGESDDPRKPSWDGHAHTISIRSRGAAKFGVTRITVPTTKR